MKRVYTGITGFEIRQFANKKRTYERALRILTKKKNIKQLIKLINKRKLKCLM